MVSGRLLVSTMLGVAWASAAGAGDVAARGADVMPGAILAQAAHGATLMDRLEALQQLGDIRDRESIRQWRVVESLVEFAKDANPRVALGAVCGLGKLCGFDPTTKADVRDPLAALLRDPSRHVLVRRAAAGQLGAICQPDDPLDRAVVLALTKVTKPSRDDPPEVCAAAVRALGAVGDPLGRGAIREALSGSDPLVRAAAIEAILDALRGSNGKAFYEPSLAPVLLGLLADASVPADARNRVGEAIGVIGAMGFEVPGAEAPFLKVLEESEDADAMLSALRGMAMLGGTKASSAFPRVFDRFSRGKAGAEDAGDARVRAIVSAMAGELFMKWSEDRSVTDAVARPLVDMLAKALVDVDRTVAAQAAIALGNLYHPKFDRTRAAQILIVVIGAKAVDDSVRGFAEESLGIISGRCLGPDAAAWAAWFEGNKAALRARGSSS